MSAPFDPMGGCDRSLGPHLDRLFPVRLGDGRIASVAHVSLTPTNHGIFEGGLAAYWNERQKTRWVQLATARYGDPVHVVDPPVTPLPPDFGRNRERLPWMACAARLLSAPIEHHMTESHLTLVWWQDPSDEPLRVWIERAAADLDWNALARDWDFS